MARLTQWLSILFPLVFTILSMSFAITATTSKEWASQNHFNANDPLQVLQTNWNHPIYVLYRSPFIYCPDGVNCYHYRPYGFKKTSCELPFALQTDDATNIGDARQCQQIHYAGNLAIASTTLIGVSFLLTLSLTLASLLLLTSSPNTASETTSPPFEETHKSHSLHHHHHPPARSILGPLAPYLTLLSLLLLLAGSLLYFIAQFYGIEALVQSAPDNGAYASAGWVGGGTDNTNHQPWVQGKAVGIYATLVWVFGVLAAGSTVSVWRVPVWGKVL